MDTCPRHSPSGMRDAEARRFTLVGVRTPAVGSSHIRTTSNNAIVAAGGIQMARYYHVIKKQGQWHLYAGNAITSLMADSDQVTVTRAARALARHDGAKVVVHKDSARDVVPHDAIPRDDVKSPHELRLPLAAVETLRPI